MALPLWAVWLLTGLAAGVLAKFLMPGRDPGGLIITIALGICGAFVGGWISSKIGYGGFVAGFTWPSLFIATGGALVILILYRVILGSPRKF